MHLHIQWCGPYDFDEVVGLRDNYIDYGIYQIYGAHPVYGSDVLLYIGKAVERCFGQRISEHLWTTGNQGSSRVTFYIGRLCSYAGTPDDDTWRKHIAIAERLLIASHQPARNSSGLKVEFNKDYHDLHILNWGNFRDILPEVSGARYSNLYDSSEFYFPYGESRREVDESANI